MVKVNNYVRNTPEQTCIKYHIEHLTTYTYEKTLDYSIHALRIRPQSSISQNVHHWDIAAPGNTYECLDGFGNICYYFTLAQPTNKIIIHASGDVTAYDTHIIPQTLTDIDACFYLRNFEQSTANIDMQVFALDHTSKHAHKADKAIALMQAIHTQIQYESKATHTHTTAQQAFKQQAGVCQDFAHIFLACARSIGLSARYVSGYFASHNAELSSHAWVDMHINSEEWLSLDVTSNTLTNQQYIRLGVGPEYSSIAPIKGMQIGGGHESMAVNVRINALSG
jgi:transglutaminase-like putative cysteine protease